MTTATGSSIEHAIGAEGLLSIRLHDGEVRLRGVDGDIARVHEVNDRDLAEILTIDLGDGSLSLRSGRGGLSFDFGSRSGRRDRGQHAPELDIELPRRATLVIEGAGGDIEADGLLGDQRYRTASGDVALRGVSGKINVEAVSGDVAIWAIASAEITARAVSGDLAVRAATLSTLLATTTSGDIQIEGRLSGAGPFSIETVSGDGQIAPSGDLRIEMTSVTGDLSSKLEGPSITRGRRSLEIGHGGPTLTFRSMSGDLKVSRPKSGAAEPAVTLAPPSPQVPLMAPANQAIAAAYDEARLRILRSLERGEIDVAEAGRRLETLDDGQPDVRPDGPDA